MNILKKLTIPVLSTFLALAPMKSYTQIISGHIGNVLKKEHYSEQGEGIPAELIFRNLNTGNTININTDEHGDFRYDPNKIIEPNFRFDVNRIREAEINDLQGRLIDDLYIPYNISYFLTNKIKKLPSGVYLYKLRDDRNNVFTGRVINVDGTIQGLTLSEKLKERPVSNKNRAHTFSIEPYEITVRDENTDEIGK